MRLTQSKWILNFCLLALAQAAQAGPTAEELKQLGTSLTPWGADKSASKDGSIPAYEGGLRKPPAGFDAKSGRWPDPFPNDKPVHSITAANAAQFADKLTPGTQELLRRWPQSFRVDVYPSRRTFSPLSKDTEQAALKNAQNPECKTVADGVGVVGCWGGIPFPVPKTGYEAMWNHLLHERLQYEGNVSAYLVTSAGDRVFLLNTDVYSEFPYYIPGLKPNEGRGAYAQRYIITNKEPARESGGKILSWQSLTPNSVESRAWSYSTGQRRVRLAPEFAYDTPVASVGGVINFDEISMFQGRMDRFEFKLVGKKELYIPYNNYRALSASSVDQLLGKQHVNPDLVRWELHRVWVVEAVAKPGKRHIASKRVFYIEEDSWTIMASEGYDQGGKMYRVQFAPFINDYHNGGTIDFASSQMAYDLPKGQYAYVSTQVGKSTYSRPGVAPWSEARLQSEAMAGSGVR